MVKDLSGLFSPKSVAVIGASNSAEKVGAIVLKNIIESGFGGKLYPVNPNETEVGGLKCYPNVEALPEVVDLAVFAIPAAIVNGVLEEIGKRGIKNALVFSAGFKEIGSEGEKLEAQLVEVANKYQINVLGPNCLGFANNNLPINITFGQVVKEKGNLRIISQSGAIASSMFDWCQSTKLGFSDFITIGNKAVVNENDILSYWSSLPAIENIESNVSKVSPIGLYLESMANGNEFVSIVSDISKKTPVFALKPGKSKAAAAAMHSHTGAIAGEDSVLDVALKQSGVIRCSDLSVFFDVARTLAWENVPLGPRVAIISNAGGPAVLSTDSINEVGLEMAQFSEETQKKLASFLPRMASFLNPIDVLGDALADRFGQAVEVSLQEETVDAVVVILTPQLMTQIEKTAEIIGTLSAKYTKPVLCSFIGGSLAAVGEKILNDFKIPSFSFPEIAINVLALMRRWQSWREKESLNANEDNLSFEQNIDTVRNIILTARNKNQQNLDNFESNEVMKAAGISTPATESVEVFEKAEELATQFGWPVVLKISSPMLLHKVDVGGVITKIKNSEELKIAWDKISEQREKLSDEVKKGARIQIQKQVDEGIEVIVGVKRDANFGPVMLFGAGGKLAELIADRNLRLLPMSIRGARELVENSKIYTMLKGFRCDLPYDLDKLYETMVRLGKLVESSADIAEIEINPLIITRDQVWAVDAKTVLTLPPKALFKVPKFRTAMTISHKILANHFHNFIFELDEAMDSMSGQFVGVKVNEQRINNYSIASRPNPTHFELLVDVSPQGVGSKFFENLKEGEKITFLEPVGIFTLKADDNSEQVIFFGTGCGIAPIRYMIEDALVDKKIQKPVVLYFGVRYKEDIFWQDIFDDLASKYPNFSYKICLSKPPEDWAGLKGHITDYIKGDFADASKCSAYLCGGNEMMEESSKLLLEQGCLKERIYFEKFR
ncbi:MAG TPA: acetate--CoA ligase family protein [Candidatus Methanoperedens sp.]|nr:acetate--CoA ligase family protein [Candidatus Methanoperedens sp.]